MPPQYVAFMQEFESMVKTNIVAIQYVCHVVSCVISLLAFLLIDKIQNFPGEDPQIPFCRVNNKTTSQVATLNAVVTKIYTF